MPRVQEVPLDFAHLQNIDDGKVDALLRFHLQRVAQVRLEEGPALLVELPQAGAIGFRVGDVGLRVGGLEFSMPPNDAVKLSIPITCQDRASAGTKYFTSAAAAGTSQIQRNLVAGLMGLKVQ